MARRRQAEASPSSPLPASKRLKTTNSTHVPAQKGLGFLVDEDARSGRKLEAKLTNGVSNSKTTRVDESHAVVAPNTKNYNVSVDTGSSPDNAIGISSGEESSSDDSSDDEAGEDGVDRFRKPSTGNALPNGHTARDQDESSEEGAIPGAEDEDMAEPEANPETADEEPSFGDLLQQRHPEAIDVQSSLPDPTADRKALISTNNSRAITAPSGTSLSTVLTQALRTNDKDLLESCFHTTDLPSIRATIERLPSQHIATLLQRLAERIHRRPGRTGSLLVWVQWSLVAHGGYLATQPDVMKRLKGLSQVVQERARGLQPLLHLKGKLDMLSAQLELRRSMQKASWAANADTDEEDEGVIYVEGQDQDWSDSGEENEDGALAGSGFGGEREGKQKTKAQNPTPITDLSDSDDGSESEEEDMPNGVVQEGADMSSDEDEDEEGLFDMEAEETSDDEDDLEKDSDDDAESQAESEDESEPSEDESDAGGVKAPQLKSLNRKR